MPDVVTERLMMREETNHTMPNSAPMSPQKRSLFVKMASTNWGCVATAMAVIPVMASANVIHR